MSLSDTLDTVVRIAAAIGLPAIVIFWVRDRRKSRAESDRAEQEVPFQVRATAATTLDAEVAALHKAFEIRVKSYESTIESQARQLVDVRAENEAKDVKIDALKGQVYTLQDKLRELQTQFDIVKREFDAVTVQLQDIQGHQ
jgi:chromosome segregation ATPase